MARQAVAYFAYRQKACMPMQCNAMQCKGYWNKWQSKMKYPYSDGEMMNTAISYISIFLISMLELWGGIPIGLGLGVHPILIIAITTIGSMSGVFIVLYIGTKMRERLIKKHPVKGEGKGRSLVMRSWDRFGIIGLSMLAPLITGAPIGAAIAIGLGESKKRIFAWMIPGILLWSSILTLLGYFGIMIVK